MPEQREECDGRAGVAKGVRTGWVRRRAVDIVLAAGLAAAAGFGAWYGSCGLDALLVRGENGDVWFEADCPRVLDNATDPHSVHSRSAVHPLLALWTYPSVTALRWGFGCDPIVAVRVLRVLVAAACMAVLFGLLRIMDCRRLDSVVFSILAATSAAAMFWFVVPETYPPGLLTILLALVLVAGSEARRVPPVWDVLVNVATLSFTVTNWMAGLLATFVRWPLRRALWIVLVAAGVSLALLAVQQQVFPSAALLPISLEEREYLLRPEAGGPGRVLVSFLFHAMVMPAIGTVTRYGDAAGPIMTVQHSWPGSAGGWGAAAAVLWAALLGLGAYGMYACRRQRRLRLALGLTVAGQLVLHLLYGLETFTYACHFGPLLVLVVAFAGQTRARRLALALVAALIVCAGINNVWQYQRASEFVEQRNPIAFVSSGQ